LWPQISSSKTGFCYGIRYGENGENAVKKTFLITMFGLLAVGCNRVGPGYVGIKVNMAGSNKGVEAYPARTGWVWYNPFSESVFEYPTFVQTAVWSKNTSEGQPLNEEITFSTGDQMQVAADISIAYRIRDDKVPSFYVTFRNDDINKFTHGFMRNMAREKFDNAAGKYKIEQIMGDNATFLNEVRSELQKAMEPLGVQIDQFGFIGAPRPPQSVVDAINSKVQATQTAVQKENELRQAQADAAKVVAESEGEAKAILTRAQAQAQANRLLNESLTTNIIELKRLEKWNGVLPQVSGAVTPFINIK
jgi:regulator of protease activity HflC (stomatin/prohibitin superfamily)